MSCMPSPFSLISFLHYLESRTPRKSYLEISGIFYGLTMVLNCEDSIARVRWAGPAGAEVAPRAEAVKTD